MSKLSTTQLTGIMALVVALGISSAAWAQNAQQPPAAQQPAAAAPATGAQKPAAEVDERTAILKSEEWQETSYWFNQWLSVQEMYSKDEVAQMRMALDRQISNMSADELRAFLREVEHKLAILLSDEAKDARAWVGRYLAAHTKMSREDLRKRLPDPVNMTAAQLDDWLRRFQEERAGTKETQAAVERLRAQQAQATRQSLAGQRKYAESALDRASRDRSYYGSTAPRSNVQNLPRSRYAPVPSVYGGAYGGGLGYRPLYYSGAGAW